MSLFTELQSRGIELIREGTKLRVRGRLNDDDRMRIRAQKADILAELQTMEKTKCQGCTAAGYWDHAAYGGKLLCFAYAVFEGKAGRPKSCNEAIMDCRH